MTVLNYIINLENDNRNLQIELYDILTKGRTFYGNYDTALKDIENNKILNSAIFMNDYTVAESFEKVLIYYIRAMDNYSDEEIIKASDDIYRRNNNG